MEIYKMLIPECSNKGFEKSYSADYEGKSRCTNLFNGLCKLLITSRKSIRYLSKAKFGLMPAILLSLL
jgi:hypothetical protein